MTNDPLQEQPERVTLTLSAYADLMRELDECRRGVLAFEPGEPGEPTCALCRLPVDDRGHDLRYCAGVNAGRKSAYSDDGWTQGWDKGFKDGQDSAARTLSSLRELIDEALEEIELRK